MSLSRPSVASRKLVRHLTDAEVAALADAAKGNRWGTVTPP